MKGSFLALLEEPVLWIGVAIPGYLAFLFCRGYANSKTVPPWNAWIVAFVIPVLWGLVNWVSYKGQFIPSEFATTDHIHISPWEVDEGFLRFYSDFDRGIHGAAIALMMLPFTVIATRRSVTERKNLGSHLRAHHSDFPEIIFPLSEAEKTNIRAKPYEGYFVESIIKGSRETLIADTALGRKVAIGALVVCAISLFLMFTFDWRWPRVAVLLSGLTCIVNGLRAINTALCVNFPCRY